jgi:hypothetical protein
MGFLAAVITAETITTYSVQYAMDLDQKQVLLRSGGEDACKTNNDSRKNSDKAKAVEKKRTSYLGVENIDLAKFMTPVEKIKVASICMNGTLSPISGWKRLSRTTSKSRN